eukprot:m.160237 g.160237  ORF g.160237 m.160237 type:complete len:585 (+) comp31177_c0_seq1:228-1982(+)
MHSSKRVSRNASEADLEPLLAATDAAIDLESGLQTVAETQSAGSFPIFTEDEVAKHNSTADCWVIIDDGVYDVTDFLNHHPGGAAALSKEGRGGKDVSKHFDRIGHSDDAKQILSTLRVGSVKPRKLDNEWFIKKISGDVPPDLEGHATGWHGERRKAILEAHPEVAKLQGSNHLTIPIGVAVSFLHGWVCMQCQHWGWFTMFFMAYTVGAWCKMAHFAVGHDICHGTAGFWAWWTPLRHVWHHVCSLPAIGGEIQHYYAYQHIGHHAALGEDPFNAVSLDSFDGDLTSPATTMLMLAYKGVHVPLDMWQGKPFLTNVKYPFTVRVLFKILFATGIVSGFLVALVIGQVMVAVTINPIVMIGMVVMLCMPYSWFQWLIPYTKATPEAFNAMLQSQALRTATWASIGVAFHTLLWVGSAWWLLFRANKPDFDPTISSVAKGFIYLTMSELFLHGWLIHPYFGYFLGVHRSFGGDFKHKGVAPPPVPADSTSCQPTMSTYSLLTALSCMNLNYHVEHHDFPKVPWSRLHLVYRAAPEFYDGLEWSPGFVHTIYQWFLHGEEWNYACHAPGGGLLPQKNPKAPLGVR